MLDKDKYVEKLNTKSESAKSLNTKSDRQTQQKEELSYRKGINGNDLDAEKLDIKRQINEESFSKQKDNTFNETQNQLEKVKGVGQEKQSTFVTDKSKNDLNDKLDSSHQKKSIHAVDETSDINQDVINKDKFINGYKKENQANSKNNNDKLAKINTRGSRFREDSKVSKQEKGLEKINTRSSKVGATSNALAKFRGYVASEGEDEDEKKKKTNRDAERKQALEALEKTAASGGAAAATGGTSLIIAKAVDAVKGVQEAVFGENQNGENNLLLWGVMGSILLGLIILVVMIAPILMMSTMLKSLPSITTYNATAAEVYLYHTLMDYYEDNETAVLGIMCNIDVESDGFQSNILEYINQTKWGITKETYTEAVNNGTLTKEEFCKDSWMGNTRGHVTSRGWYNPDGGYGFCQYTSYDKKASLYEYAKAWYDSNEENEYPEYEFPAVRETMKNSSFDIGNYVMQSHYIVYLLKNDYSWISDKIKTAPDIETAAWYWLKYYEVPAHDTNDYHDEASERVKRADRISSECKNTAVTDYNFEGSSNIDKTYFKHQGSGPCHACAIATVTKRYHAMMGDPYWDDVTPYAFTEDSITIHDAIVSNEGAGDTRVWYCLDKEGNVHQTTEQGWSPSTGDITVNISGSVENGGDIEYPGTCSYPVTFHTVGSGISNDEMITLLASHPEGVVVYSRYGSNGFHAKVITRYDESNGIFYCIDTINDGYAGVGEVPLSETYGWYDFSRVESYKYISNSQLNNGDYTSGE